MGRGSRRAPRGLSQPEEWTDAASVLWTKRPHFPRRPRARRAGGEGRAHIWGPGRRPQWQLLPPRAPVGGAETPDTGTHSPVTTCPDPLAAGGADAGSEPLASPLLLMRREEGSDQRVACHLLGAPIRFVMFHPALLMLPRLRLNGAQPRSRGDSGGGWEGWCQPGRAEAGATGSRGVTLRQRSL